MLYILDKIIPIGVVATFPIDFTFNLFVIMFCVSFSCSCASMRDPPEDEVCPRCQRCERWRTAPDYFRDPMILWDRFPCPPPGTDHARLLIELDWTGTMGTKAGCEALQRVAKRCHVDLKTYHSLPSSFPDCEELFEAGILCGTNCFIAFILAGICVLFCLLLVLVCVRYV